MVSVRTASARGQISSIPGFLLSAITGGLAVRIQQIQQRKGDILRVLRQGLGSNGAGVLGRFRLRRARPEVAQHRHATFTNDFVANFVHSGKYTANPTRHSLIWHRAIRNRKMGLLDKPIPVDFQSEILHPGCRAAVIRCLDEGTNDVPDLGPAGTGGLPHGLWMFGAEHGSVGIVVELAEVRAPPEQQGETIAQQEAHHHTEAR